MKREEQIEVATAAYIRGRLRNNVPPEEIEEIRLAYQAGAIYADQNPINYDGKAMLHVLNKGAAIERRQMLDKATRWLLDEMFVEDVEGEPYVMSATASSIEEFIGNFKRAMNEQQ